MLGGGDSKLDKVLRRRKKKAKKKKD